MTGGGDLSALSFEELVEALESITRQMAAGDIGIEAVRQNAYEGVTERELARAAYAAMFANGADGVALPSFTRSNFTPICMARVQPVMS